MSQPLDGVRILDLTQAMAGPFCTMLLGDMGADIVKIEPPGHGEMTRRGLGFRMKGEDTAAFLAVNRNKRSVTVNLKSEEGLAVFRELARDVDVVVENFRPGVAARLGVDYASVRGFNPAVVYASISGFGQTGRYASRPGFDLIAQGMAGVMSVTGDPGGHPVKCGVPIGDLGAGLYCAFGILNAYIARERTGQGQHIDVSLFESALALSVWEAAELWGTGRVPQACGSAHRLTAPYQALRTQDGYVTVGANNHRLWLLLCDTIGRRDLVEDERFASNDDRMQHRGELEAELETTLVTAPTAEWLRRFELVGFPAGPINTYQDVFDDPHVADRQMIEEYEHPVEGTVRTLGIPVKLSGTPASVRRPAPLLGEHTDEVLREAGLDGERIAALRSAAAI